jgi:uncharacterized protein YndB with AHSA1/START domain
VSAVHSRQELVVTRVLEAPRERVWKAWTEAERLAQWWGPKGSTIRVIKLDLRLGGIFHYAMQFQPGHDMFGRFIYREIAAPERLVFVSSFSDPAGGVTRAPFAQNFPREVHNTLTLAEQNGRTALTLRGGPLDASDEEWKAWLGMHESMQKGFAGTLDQLAGHLAQA